MTFWPVCGLLFALISPNKKQGYEGAIMKTGRACLSQTGKTDITLLGTVKNLG